MGFIKFFTPMKTKRMNLHVHELLVSKDRNWLPLLMGLRSGKVVFIGDGRGADSLKPFWKRLKRSRARIRAVATDRSAAYIGSVLEHLPGAAVVLDHFHVVKLMNDRLTEVRRKLHRELQGKMGKCVLKDSRWILLKNPENLSLERQEHEWLQEALEANEPLAQAYYLKDELRQIWKQPDKAAAVMYLEQWISNALASDVGPLVKMGQDYGHVPHWHPGLVRPPHIFRTYGRNQQQDQDAQKAGMQLSGPGTFQTQDNGDSRG